MSPDREGPVAAVDCGTNSTRLLVMDRQGRALLRVMRITRLGEGVDATRKLSPEAIERTVAVLAEMRAEMERLGVARARLVATSAVRDAANRDEFLGAASAATGVGAEVLSGQEEGRLAYAGAAADLPPAEGDDVIVDIGGGSTELVLERGGRISATSLDLGCVRLTERHFTHDPPTGAELASAVAHVRAELDRAYAAIGTLRALLPGSRLIGLAGTVSTLAALEQGLSQYDRERLHHFELTASAVARWCDTLAGETAAARGKRPGMVPGRQDVIVGGALVLREVLSGLGMETCTVSESDILDGIALDLLHRSGA
jgi:exopolyphosphatase/guanosine-5'-triphosphate,3'-diphosphate pyrophosphatase